MTYRPANKLAGIVAIATLLWPLPRLLATDCACPKPKVEITAAHTITPASYVKVFFVGVEVPPDAEPVAMERDVEYILTVTLDSEAEFDCSVDIDLTFPHCSMEYSRDYGSTWTKGSRTWITVHDDEPFTYTPTSILIRITDPASDSSTGSPAPGDEADSQSTPPAYTYNALTETTVTTPPGLGLEIPMGMALTPEGYRSAGLLTSYGPVSAQFVVPSNLNYNAIAAVGSSVIQHVVPNQSSGVAEKHYSAPQGALRVRGWVSANQTEADWTGAQETLVQVYAPENYNESTHVFSGEPHSYYRLEVATGNGLQPGFRLVQSNHGKVKIRSFQASSDGLLLRETKDPRVTESIAVPLFETSWEAVTTVREGGDVISSVTEVYELKGTRYLAVSREDPIGTTYTSYYEDGRVRSVSRPDNSWSFYTYEIISGNSSETICYSPWMSSSSLADDNGVPSLLPTSGMVVKRVSTDGIYGSSSHSFLVDLSSAVTYATMSGTSSSKSYGSVLTLTTHTTERNSSDHISSYSLAYADEIVNRFLAGRTRMTWDATGRATLFQYEKGTWNGSAFTQDDSGTVVRASTITGYISSPTALSTPDNFTAIPAHSTKEVTITAAEGVVREETYVCSGATSYALALTEDHEYETDGQRRHIGVKIEGVYVSKTEYVTPNVTRQLDQEGTITETETNASGDVIRTTTFGNTAVPAVTTTYRRSGLTTTTTVKGQVVSIETRDGAGRVISSQDASGAVVETDYSDGGRTVTRTAPGGVTTVDTRHYDGQAESITGTGVIPRYYDYVMDPSGLNATITTVGDVQDNPRVTSVTRNWDGSTYADQSPDPDPASGYPVVLLYEYVPSLAALRRITSSAANTADQVQLNPVQLDPVIADLAAMGHYTLAGTETGSNGPDINSTDRLTETSTSYVESDGVWKRQTVTRVFHTNDSNASYTQTTLDALAPVTIDQGLRWISSRNNGATTVTTTRDSFFNEHKSVLSTDDLATTASPDSVSVSNHGRTISNSAYGDTNPETMAYDAAGRIARHTSATKADTHYIYNAAGQLERTVDHMGKPTIYEYYPANDAAAGLLWKSTNPEDEVTETLYNSRGQVVVTRGSGVYRVEYDYNDYGERNKMWTYRTPGGRAHRRSHSMEV